MKLHNIISKATMAVAVPLALICGGAMSSCADLLDTNSEMVQFAEDNHIDTPQDTIFSVMGIIRQMQVIADRTLLLGEVRSDMVSTTNKASKDIKDMAAFNFSDENKYNHISDYYAVINSCNFFIANADTTLKRLGQHIFEREYAAVKTYRAWTYLQMAKIYGAVPLVLDPVLTEADAQREMQKTPSDINAICSFFIDDIKNNVDTELPKYGSMDVYNSEQFFIPVRVLLGDLCLWSGRYQEAAQYLSDYLTLKNHPVYTGTSAVRWNVTGLDFTLGSITNSYIDGFSSSRSSEVISMIPMEDNEFYGVKSDIDNVFSSTEFNYYYNQVTPSKALRENFAAENYCYLDINKAGRDTVYAPKERLAKEEYVGDLRFTGSYRYSKLNVDEFSKYSSDYQTITKNSSWWVILYRRQQVYLMFAEALCRAGYPESAFCILKYGLTNQNILRYINETERENAASLLTFSDDDFPESMTQGIHARGCGNVECDTLYCLPQPEKALASYSDTVQYQIPLVEDMIVREMMLEKAFEGQRYYDLMRVALRRGNPAYLAEPISKRNGEKDESLYSLLLETKNWYLPRK